MPERLRFAHQFNPVIAYGDAVGNDCLELQRIFWSSGVRSDLFAAEAKPEMRALTRSWDELGLITRRDGLLLVHHSIGTDTVPKVLASPARKAIVYHNITPGHYFAGLNDYLKSFAELGREQLKELAKAAEFGIADSEYNRKELEAAGLANTAVVPALVDWEDFDRPPDPEVARELADERTSILSVGQILPHKAVHDVVAAFAKYRESDRTAHLYLVGSNAMSGSYLDRVRGDIRRLGLDDAVTLTGSVTIEQLVAYYRGATAFLTLSEHEGFCVPLLEAMRSDLPVVANAAAAIPETLGDGGILLENKTPETVAAQLERVVHDQALRKDLIEKGRRRVDAFSRSHVADRLKLALAQGGWDLPDAKSKKVVVMSSDQRCGIHHYSLAVTDGLRDRGHQVTFVGVKHLDTADLYRKLKFISSAERCGAHRARGRDLPRCSIRASARLALAEAPPGHPLDARARAREVPPLPPSLGRAALQPALPHAARDLENALGRPAHGELVPAIPPRPDVHGDDPAEARRAFDAQRQVAAAPHTRPRQARALPAPDHAPREHGAAAHRGGEAQASREVRSTDGQVHLRLAGLLLRAQALQGSDRGAARRRRARAVGHEVGAGSREYFDEITELAKTKPNVVINTEYNTMGEYVAAADAVVLFYEDVFQSAVVTQAVWAGLPCIFSEAEGFAPYHAAGPVVRSSDELAKAMREIQKPETYAKYSRGVRILRRLLSPERNAERYLAGIE